MIVSALSSPRLNCCQSCNSSIGIECSTHKLHIFPQTWLLVYKVPPVRLILAEMIVLTFRTMAAKKLEDHESPKKREAYQAATLG